jgi:hypothetical protein
VDYKIQCAMMSGVIQLTKHNLSITLFNLISGFKKERF